MKKILILISLFFLTFAYSKSTVNDLKKDGTSLLKKSKVLTDWVYSYLYQSTCGKTFVVILTTRLEDLNSGQKEELDNFLVEQNQQLCSGPQEPSTSFT